MDDLEVEVVGENGALYKVSSLCVNTLFTRIVCYLIIEHSLILDISHV